MQFHFSFKHMDTSPALQTYAEEKLAEKIEKFVTKPISGHFTFSVHKHEHTAHFSLDGGDGFKVEVEHTSGDMYASVDYLADKLSSQLKKHKEKLKNHKVKKGHRFVPREAYDHDDSIDAADILKYEQGRRRASGR